MTLHRARHRVGRRDLARIPRRPPEALSGVDVTMLMGVRDAEARATAERTRNLLTQLGARPFLARLEAALGPESPVKADRREATSDSEDAMREVGGKP